MDYNIIYVEYEVYHKETLITKGKCPTFFLNSLADAFVDFPNSEYTLKVTYNNKTLSASRPQ
jgi:hypothetical protein